MINKYCPVCNSLMSSGLKIWHWECSKCGYEKAEFEPAINETVAHEKIDEHNREAGLRSLRLENFEKLLKAIENNGHSSGALLDVGCAHGWFLEAAQKRQFQALGIEPDRNIFKIAAQRGLPVRQGFFPEILKVNEKFNVIIFNDVFEHIPDLNSVLTGCRKHLEFDGVLVLNLPSSSGVFYKTARFLCALGIGGFFDRLWQKDFPSPHLHYFNRKNLKLLLEANGFKEVFAGNLPILRLKGLFARVSHTGEYSLPISFVICILISFIAPFLWLMPSDNVYSIFKKTAG